MESKSALRKSFLTRRSEVSPVQKRLAEQALAKRLLESPLYKDADILLFYAAARGELALDLILRQAFAEGKAVGFPRCLDKSGRMLFYEVSSALQLSSGMYGILEPDEKCPVLDTFTGRSVCLTPGLAFDPNGFRLGYGKGYYDRFLSGFAGTPVGVCLERFFLQKQEWEYDRYDKAVGAVLTERRLTLL